MIASVWLKVEKSVPLYEKSSAPNLSPCRPTEEPEAAIPHRTANSAPMACRTGPFRLKSNPEKITCGMRMIGIRLTALSLFGAKAETVSPIIKPASEVRAKVMYTSSGAGSKIPCCIGAIQFTARTRIALCSKHNIPKMTIFENI